MMVYSQIVKTALLLIPLIVLAGCGALLAGSSVPPPPSATPVASGANKNLDGLLDDLSGDVQELLRQRRLKTKEQQRYASSQDVKTVAGYYADELTQEGWERAPFGAAQGTGQSLLAYRKGDEYFVVVVLDARPYSGQGSVIYALRAGP
jgi:hypothetical protein